jgi:hypothetical protein
MQRREQQGMIVVPTFRAMDSTSADGRTVARDTMTRVVGRCNGGHGPDDGFKDSLMELATIRTLQHTTFCRLE